MWYKVDWNKLVLQLQPTFLRKPIIVGYLKALVKPIDDLHYDWLQKRDRDWYKLYHTGQVCKLRKLLNDRLDNDLRRIYIGEGNSFPRAYIYTSAEQKPVYLGKEYIYQTDEYSNTGKDFWVYVPQTIIDNSYYELIALLEYYKLASKRYKIQAI